MGCPLPLSLTLTPLSVGTGDTKVPSVLTLRGIRRDASQPVNLSSVNLVRRVVLGCGVPLVGPQEELRGLSGYTPRGFTSSPKREAK